MTRRNRPYGKEMQDFIDAWDVAGHSGKLELCKKHGISYVTGKSWRSSGIDTEPSGVELTEPIIIPAPVIKIKPLKQEGKRGEGEEVQVGLISDSHIGLQTPSYNFDVFKKRLSRLMQSWVNLCLLHRKMRPIKRLVVPMLGDIVQGQQIGVQMMTEEVEIVGAEEQIYDKALPEFTNFFINLLQIFSRITIYGVEGNHGNINRRSQTLTKRSNWDTVFYRALSRELSNYKEQIEVLPETHTWYQVVEINGWAFLLVHLDQIVSYMGIPFYGISRKSLRWSQSIPKHFDYILGGHFHNPNMLYNDGIPCIINGAMISDSDFPLIRMGLKDVPRQIAFFVNKRYGITARYEIQL